MLTGDKNNSNLNNTTVTLKYLLSVYYRVDVIINIWYTGVQPRLIQGIRSGDGVGDLFNYLFIKDIKSNRMRIAQ